MTMRRRIRRTPHRAVLYGRVSRDLRQGRSVSKQLGIGRRVQAAAGRTIVGEYSDNDASASRHARKGREDWERAIEHIETGEVDVLWALEISRHTRDLVVWAQLAAVCREQEMWIELEDELWDTTRPSHMKHLNQLMVDAVYESDMVQHRITQDQELSARQGRPHAPVGWGFRREYDPDTGELLRQVVDEGSAGAVERRGMASRYLAGASLRSVAADLNERLVRTPAGYLKGESMTKKDGAPLLDANGRHRVSRGWTAQQVKQMLRSPSLMGRRGYNGEVMEEGGWDGLVDPAQWWAIQARLDGQVAEGLRDGAARHLASYIATCGAFGAEGVECGSQVSILKRRSHGRDVGHRYRCDPVGRREGIDRHVSRAEHILDAQIEALLVAEFSAPDVLRRFGETEIDDAERGALVAGLERARAELERLYRSVESGGMTARMATAEEKRLLEEIAVGEEATRPRVVEPLARALADSDPAVVLATWRGWSLEQQRVALRTFTTEIVVLPLAGGWKVPPGESVRITWVGERA